MSNRSSISELRGILSPEGSRKRARVEEEHEDDTLLISSDGGIDQAKLKSRLSSVKEDIEQLLKEKDNLNREQNVHMTERDKIIAEKDELREENKKAKACLDLDDAIQPSREQLPKALKFLRTEQSVEARWKQLYGFIQANQNFIDNKIKFISENDKLIVTTMELLRDLNNKLKHLNKWKDKLEALIEQGIHVDETNTNDPQSGLLYVQQSHRIAINENSNVNIGMIERQPSYSRAAFRPKATFQRLEISDELINAWELVKDEKLTKETFIDKLVQQLQGLDKNIVRSAWQSCQIEFPSNNIESLGEMALQQFVYPPFAYLFKAAAGTRTEAFYKADDYVNSSLAILHKQKEEDFVPQPKKITIKPDAAVVLEGNGWDVSGMMEIKPGKPSCDYDHLIDYDKCALMTAVAALGIKRAMNVRDDHRYHMVAIPFIIATGKHCSLYATTLDKNGNPSIRMVQYPDGCTGRDVVFESAACMKRKEMFTALAVLLSRFKAFFDDFTSGNTTLVMQRTKTFGSIRSLNLTTRKNDTESQSTKTHSTNNTPGSGKSAEEDAKEAAACGGMFVNLECPTVKTLRFNDDRDENEEQMHSPFFFVGYKAQCSTGTGERTIKVFLKVWRVDEVKFRSVEAEWMHYKQAYDAGVPVAAPALLEIARSTSSSGSNYLIIAVEYIQQDAITNLEDVVQFSYSLIDSVEKLHKQAKLLHCDLKPDNLRWRGGVVHLIDFEHSQPIGRARILRSTEDFEAPEISKAMPCSTLTDAFSVGKTILCKLEGLNDMTNHQSLSYGILHDIAVNLTHLDAKSRLNLKQALDKVQECITMQKISHSHPSRVKAMP